MVAVVQLADEKGLVLKKIWQIRMLDSRCADEEEKM
jgi:hypothetical protein